jgi:hypothetical protein
MQGKAVYIRPKVAGPFPRPCASRSYMHRAALYGGGGGSRSESMGGRRGAAGRTEELKLCRRLSVEKDREGRTGDE